LSERESAGAERDGAPTLGEDPEAYAPSVAGRLAFYQRAGGIITPLTTTVVAFFMGGIVVLATGHNPLQTYKSIFEEPASTGSSTSGRTTSPFRSRTHTSGSGGTRTRTTRPRTT
jgi:hypothetical protein